MNQAQFPQEVQEWYAEKSLSETLDIQMKMAEDFANEIKMLGSDMNEITALSVLDTLGVCGLSFTVSEVASNAFLRECGAKIA